MSRLPATFHDAFLVAAGFLAASLAATWPIARHLGSALPGDLGDPLLNTWILAWDADRLAHGFRGLWNAPIFYPAQRTLTWSEHLLAIAVPLAPLQWATRNPVLVYNVAFLSSYVLAGLGMYVLARELGLGRAASLVGACAFAFAPYRADQITHLQVLMTGWAPLALAALHRFLRTGSLRAALAFGAAYALLALSNTYYLFFFALPVGIVWLHGWLWPRVPRRALAAGTGAAAVIASVLAGPVLFAYWRTARATGLARAWDEIADLSARPVDYVSVAGATQLWHAVLPVAPAEHALFPGLATLVLAAIGLGYAARRGSGLPGDTRRAAWLYAAVVALAAWGSLGPRGGLYAAALSMVPGLDALRMVTRLVSVVSLALAVLAALGAEWLLVGRRRGGAAPAAAVMAAVLFAEGLAAPLPVRPFDPRLPAGKRPMYAWLGDQPPGGVLELPIEGPALGDHTLLYQYATLFHRHPIVNGYSGSGSALQDFLAGHRSPVYEPGRLPELLEALRGIGVRIVIAHPNWIASDTRAEWLRQAMAAVRDQIETDFYGGDAIAWRLKPGAPPRPVDSADDLDAIERGTYSVTASAGEAAAHLSDGNLGTRWTTAQAQAGREWVRVNLGGPVDVRRMELALWWRRVREYPRRVQVESVDERGESRVLYSGSTLPHLLAALMQPGPAVRLALPLPANRSVTLVIRQTDTAPAPWSVDELRLWRTRP